MRTKININKIIQPKPEHTISENICLRGKVDTGYRCNLKCDFCYTLNNVLDKPKDVLSIFKQIDTLKSAGITEIEFSGGEPTIHPKWFSILEYSKLYFNYFSVVTNGTKFDDIEFLEKSIQLGINEILFSLHGHDAASHDSRVGKNGSFDKMMKAFDNINSLVTEKNYNIKIRINSIVDNKFNPIKHAKLISDIYKKYDLKQINFLPINFWDDAERNTTLNYSLVSENLKICIDILDIKTNLDINVRYIPYCFMIGYEKYCVSTYQHIFDKSDWNLLSYQSRTDMNNNKIFNPIISKETMYDQAYQNRLEAYTKKHTCTECKYLYLCDGVEKKLENQMENLQPIYGQRILDLNHFRENK